MSGSREKQLRKLEREQNPEAYQKKKKKQQGLSKGKKIAITVISCVVCVLLIGGIITAVFMQSGGFTRMVTAAKVGDYSLSAADYNYYYYGAYQNFVSQNQSYLSMYGLDTEESLSSQECPFLEEGTWADYFRQTAENSISTTYALADTAEKEGYQFTEDDQAYMDMIFDTLENAASSQNVSLDTVLENSYGPGVNYSVFESQVKRETLADSYRNYLIDNYNFTEEEINASYTENQSSIDQATYHSLLIATEDYYPESVTSSSATEEQKAAAKEAAKAAADEMLGKIAQDGSNFKELCSEYADEEDKAEYEGADDPSLSENRYKSNVSDSTVSTWLFDNARTAGEKTVLETSTGYQVVYLVDKGKTMTNVVDVRHILLAPSSTVDQTEGMTEEQTQEVTNEAQTILDTWKSGEATEASFAQLARENSTDTGSSYTGGLYEDVYPGQMVDSFNDWCFDTARKPGDTGIVTSTYGAHVMYFVGTGDPYWKVQARSYLANDKYSEYLEGLLANYTIAQDGFGFGFTAQL